MGRFGLALAALWACVFIVGVAAMNGGPVDPFEDCTLVLRCEREVGALECADIVGIYDDREVLRLYECEGSIAKIHVEIEESPVKQYRKKGD